MVVIQIHIGNNTIKDVLLDRGFGVNIVTKHLILKLGLPKPKPTPCNLGWQIKQPQNQWG
jgi:hypothetical protein